jgi:hypothetical protein
MPLVEYRFNSPISVAPTSNLNLAVPNLGTLEVRLLTDDDTKDLLQTAQAHFQACQLLTQDQQPYHSQTSLQPDKKIFVVDTSNPSALIVYGFYTLIADL